MKKLIVCVVAAAFLLTGCQKDYIKEGTGLLEGQKYSEAVKSFEKAVDEKQDVAEGLRGLGMAYYEQKEYQKAKDAFLEVLDKGGRKTPALYNLIGVCSMRLDDAQAALDAFQKGIALASAGIGRASEAGKEDGALQEMRYNEIVCYEKLLDWESAKAKAQDYVSLYPDDKEAQKEAAFLRTR